jgi:ATP-dependent helicase/nuclease subunit A
MRVLNDPEFGDIFAAEALAETPIAGIINGQPIAGVIDRLLVTDDAVLIVDYKSNRPPPATADATPVEYLAQMAVYRDLAAQAFPGRDVKAALLWTEAPRLVALPDNLIAPHSLAQSA